MAALTRSRVLSLTLGMSFTTRETVCWDTPATRATSAMLTAFRVSAAPLASPLCVLAMSNGLPRISIY